MNGIVYISRAEMKKSYEVRNYKQADTLLIQRAIYEFNLEKEL